MTNTIEANTLRDWLESHEPVVVVDVRSDEDRAQWAIPGSVHINAYEALKTGQPGALASAMLPTDRPVITVCNAGRVSQTAAAILADRGLDARTLVGGMKAWSLAWNTRAVAVDASSAYNAGARQEAAGLGRADTVRFVHADVVYVAAELPAATLVTLDRS